MKKKQLMIRIGLTCACGSSVEFYVPSLRLIEEKIPKGWFVARDEKTPDRISCKACESKRI